MATAPDPKLERLAAEARESIATQIEGLCAIAFPMGMRVAVRFEEPMEPFSMFSLLRFPLPSAEPGITLVHVMLGPGEKPPEGYQWTIYGRPDMVPPQGGTPA